MSLALKEFLKFHFDFSSMKKMGIYPKNMKPSDYEGQAAKVCWYFGFKSVYQYAQMGETRCHISYAGERPLHINEKGELKTIPFVEVINPNQLHIKFDEIVPPAE